MADETTTTWDDLMYELRQPLQELFPKKFVLSAEFTGNLDKTSFSGSQARVPIILSQLQGGGGVAETGTVNTPHATRTDQAHIDVAEIVFPISISKKLRRQAISNSAAEAVAKKVQMARVGLARIENEMMHGADSNGLLAAITDSSTDLTLTVDPAAVCWRQLYPGRIVDILTRATGADPGQGLSRKIESVDKSTGVITMSTASQGGGSGSIVHTSADGIYIEGTYGNGLQTIRQVTAQTGTFEDIDKAAVVEWKGTDGRAGDSDVIPLTTSILDGAIVELGSRSEAGDVEWGDNYFGVGDPKVLNLYAQGYYSQTRMPIETKTLDTGFSGVTYEGRPLVKDFDAQPKAVRLLHKPSFKLYQLGESLPDFDTETGSMWMRFNRTLSTEAWLYDARQLGAVQCATSVELLNLKQAA